MKRYLNEALLYAVLSLVGGGILSGIYQDPWIC